MNNISLLLSFADSKSQECIVAWEVESNDRTLQSRFPLAQRFNRFNAKYRIQKPYSWLTSSFERLLELYDDWRNSNYRSVQQNRSATVPFTWRRSPHLLKELFSLGAAVLCSDTGEAAPLGHGIIEDELQLYGEEVLRLISGSNGSPANLNISVLNGGVAQYFPWELLCINPDENSPKPIGTSCIVTHTFRSNWSITPVKHLNVRHPVSWKLLNKSFGDYNANQAVCDLLRRQPANLRSVRTASELSNLTEAPNIPTKDRDALPSLVYVLGHFTHKASKLAVALTENQTPVEPEIILEDTVLRDLPGTTGSSGGNREAVAILVFLSGCKTLGITSDGLLRIQILRKKFRIEDDVEIIVTHGVVSRIFAAKFAAAVFLQLSQNQNLGNAVRLARLEFAALNWIEGSVYSVIGNGVTAFTF